MNSPKKIVCGLLMLMAVSAHAEWKLLSHGNYQSSYIDTPYRKITDDTLGVFILIAKNKPVIVSYLYDCKASSVNWFEINTYKKSADNNIALDESAIINKTRQMPNKSITSTNPRLLEADVAFAQAISSIAPPINEVCKK